MPAHISGCAGAGVRRGLHHAWQWRGGDRALTGGDAPLGLGGALMGVRGGTTPGAACWAGSAGACPAAPVRGDSGRERLAGPEDRDSAFTRMKDVAFFLCSVSIAIYTSAQGATCTSLASSGGGVPWPLASRSAPPYQSEPPGTSICCAYSNPRLPSGISHARANG